MEWWIRACITGQEEKYESLAGIINYLDVYKRQLNYNFIFRDFDKIIHLLLLVESCFRKLYEITPFTFFIWLYYNLFLSGCRKKIDVYKRQSQRRAGFSLIHQ